MRACQITFAAFAEYALNRVNAPHILNTRALLSASSFGILFTARSRSPLSFTATWPQEPHSTRVQDGVHSRTGFHAQAEGERRRGRFE